MQLCGHGTELVVERRHSSALILIHEHSPGLSVQRTRQPVYRPRCVRLSAGLDSTSFELVKLLFGLAKEGRVFFILLDHPIDERFAVSRRCIVLCVTELDVLLNRIDAPYAKNIVGVNGLSPDLRITMKEIQSVSE
jgi:hypothetical protein